jgi:hypothetical protein
MRSNTQEFQLPNQKIPEAKWTKKYYLEHGNRMIQHIGNGMINERDEIISRLYATYSCELDSKEMAANNSVTKQYGYNLGVQYTTYPLAEMVVDQLVSEYLALDTEKKAYSINKDAINERLDKKVEYVSEEIFRDINKELESELGFEPETENPEIELPDDIEQHFTKNYKTNSEELSDDLIENFMDNLKEKRKLKTLLLDFLISERCCGTIDVKDGHPTIIRTKYNETYYDLNPDEEIQTDINIFSHFPHMTENEILNKYILDKAQKKKITQAFESMAQGNLLDSPFDYGNRGGRDVSGYENCKEGVSYRGWQNEGTNSSFRLKVLKMKWKSRKELRAKIHLNEHTGEEIFTLVKKDYKPRKRDKIKTVSVEIVRFVEMLGPEVLLSYGEEKERVTLIDNKKKVILDAFALVGRNTMYSVQNRSVVSKIEPLQKFASDILFEMRLAIKANNGRVLVYDTAQIPKQFVDTYGAKNAINRMLHHVKKDKILLFNSKDKRDSTFNQFTALDLSNSKQTQELINALMLVENLARKVVGISPERAGEVGQYQTKAGTDRAVLGSNARTEVYYQPFDELNQVILNKLIRKSKSTYKEGQVFNYTFGDLKTKFLVIYKQFLNTDIGIFFGNRFKDKRAKEVIDRAAEQALSNATDKELILDLINVLNADHASESKAILESGLKRFAEIQSQNAQAAQEAEAVKQQHEKDLAAGVKEIADDKNVNNIDVANIYNNGKTFNASEDRTSEELKTAAKIELELIKAEKDDLNKEKAKPAEAK